MLNSKYIVINHCNSLHRVESLNLNEMTIGRSRSCEIFLNDSHVSRSHAQLRVDDNQVRIKDLGSRNGTYINGQQIKDEVALREGDEVGIGPFTLRFCKSSPPEMDDSDSDDVEISTLIPKDGFLRFRSLPTGLPVLTPAQRRVLDGFLDGNTEKEIATRLELSQHTVHTHAKAIYRAYCVSTRAELIARHLSLFNNPTQPTQHDDSES